MIEQGSIWEYQGDDGTPRGLYHAVIQSGKKEVITWSEPTDAMLGDIAGFTWMGPVADFQKDFRHVADRKGGPK